MEKIQAAIAKARALRRQTAQPPADGPDPALAPLVLQPAERVAEAAPAGARAGAPIPAPEAQPTPAPEAQPTPAPEVQTIPVPEAQPSASPAEAAWRGLPAFTPDPQHLHRNRVMAAEVGPDALSFDVLRTRMLQQMRANGWSRVAITSPGTGCGKSMLALNLAFSLARQPEQRTIVIEADLRRPTLARNLGLQASHDVSRVLAGLAPFSEHAVRIGDNLAIATQAHVVRSPAELLQGAAVEDALAAVTREFEPTVMLFDLPPMQAGDDAMAFVGKVDAVLIVAAAEMTTIKQIDHCERELATQCNVMGVVLNRCRYLDQTSHYEYGY